MRAYTLAAGGVLHDGIALTDGAIVLGARPMDRRHCTVPVDHRATITDGRLVEQPGRGALVLLDDQSGTYGSWHIRAAQPESRYDAMARAEEIPNALDRILASERVRAQYPHRSPTGWYEFARGTYSPSVENARPLLRVYGFMENGAAFEIRRRGRLDGTPSVFRVACDKGGVVTVTDPKVDAMRRKAAT